MPDPVTVRRVLVDGELTLQGQIPSASNLTLVCQAHLDDTALRCVYKPVCGETPLWDFPDGSLAGREVAARLIDQTLGWELIPETVLRSNGPAEAALGPGMLQVWIDQPDQPASPEPVEIVPADAMPEGYIPVLRAHDADGSVVALAHDGGDARLRQLAVLDAVLNNADRKAGHILTGRDGRLYGIDHGLTLHTEPKLRTLLWGWAGSPVDDALRTDLATLAGALAPDSDLSAALNTLISGAEIAALADRVQALAAGEPLPHPPGRRAIPWPPF